MNTSRPTDPDADPDLPADSNPYQPPSEELATPPVVNQSPGGLPKYHWPLVGGLVAVTIILMMISPAITGLFFTAFVSVLAGGIRTAWVVSTCAKAGYQLASYGGVLVVSIFLGFFFQFAASVMFFIVCLAGLSFHSPGVNQNTFEEFWLGLSGVVGIGAYIALIWLSGWIAIASRRVHR